MQRVYVLVEHEGGMRFRATADGYTVTTGQGTDGDVSRDSMNPTQLWVGALGMCIAAYVLGYCNNHGIPADGLTVEIDRETAQAPSRMTRLDAKIRLAAPLSEKQRRAILQVASHCYIHKSMKHGMEVDIAFPDGSDGQLSTAMT
jgi:putative redox protein